MESAGISGEGPVFPDDPVAGEDQGKRVDMVGGAYSPAGPGAADSASQFTVADGTTVGDTRQPSPHQFLKRGAVKRQGKGKAAALPLQVLGDLPVGFG